MLSEGVEPSRHRHWFLKPACLPFHQESEIYNFERKKYPGRVSNPCFRRERAMS